MMVTMKKWLLFFLIASFLITGLLWTVRDSSVTTADGERKLVQHEMREINLNEFLDLYNDGQFEDIILRNQVQLEWYVPFTGAVTRSGLLNRWPTPEELFTVFQTNKPADTSLPDLGIALTGATNISVVFTQDNFLSKLLLEQVLPLVFFILILVLAFRIFGPKWWGMPWFGIKAWQLRTEKDVQTRFKDVAWMEEVKDELVEVVDFLKHPKKYQKVGAKIPKWVLLWWPPWSGKTLLAKAVAWESGVAFFSASWSEFMEMLVWMWAAKVRELFKKAKAAAPAIIFIDEIDTIGRKRWAWYTGWHQEQEQTLNQILTEMDWFDTGSNVIVIAATNRPEILDAALLRSGRFDRKIMVWNPTLEERKQILEIHTQDKKLGPDADLETLARRTSGFVGADLANVINEAALKIAKENRKQITMADLDYALEKVIMGPEKKIKTLKEHERNIVTYHELWHAVTAYLLPNADPVEKISIVSRGMALWVTWMMPEEDRYLYSKAKFMDEMVTLLWWRAAEEVFFWADEITTWASNDFEKVTKIASNMLLKYWMDDEIGTLLRYDKDKSEFYHFKPYSEKFAQKVDEKIQQLVQEAYNKAVMLIKKNKKIIEKMAHLLKEKEYISKDEFLAMMDDPKTIDEKIEAFTQQHRAQQEQQPESFSKQKILTDDAAIKKEVESFLQE
jgi:cell division protease FtsH